MATPNTKPAWFTSGSAPRAPSQTPPPTSMANLGVGSSIPIIPVTTNASSSSSSAVTTLQRELATARQECSRLENLCARQTNLCSVLEARNKELTAKVGDLEQQRAADNRAKINADNNQQKAKKTEEKFREVVERCNALEEELKEEQKDKKCIRHAAEVTVAQWKDRCTALEAEKVEALRRVNELQANIAAVEENCHKLALTIKEKDNDANTMRSQMHKLEEQLRVLEASRKMGDQDFANLKGIISSLEEQAEEKQRDLMELGEKLHQRDVAIMESDKKISHLQKLLAETRHDGETALRETDGLKEALVLEQVKNNDLVSRIEILQAELKSLRDRHNTLETTIKAHQVSMEENERKLAARNATINELRERQNELREQISSKDRENLDLSIRISGLQTTNTAFDNKLLLLMTQKQALEQELQLREKRLREASVSRDMIQQEAMERETRLVAASTREAEHAESVAKIQESLKEELQRVQEERNNLLHRLAVADQSVETLRAELMSLGRNHAEVASENTSCKAEIVRVSEELEAARALIVKKETELDTASKAREDAMSHLQHAITSLRLAKRVVAAAVRLNSEAQESETDNSEDAATGALQWIKAVACPRIEAHLSELDEVKSTLESTRSIVTRLESEVNDASRTNHRHHEQLSQVKEMLNEESTKNRSLISDKIVLEHRVDELLISLDARRTELEASRVMVRDLKADVRDLQEQMAIVDKARRAAEASLREYKSEHAHERDRHAAYKKAHEDMVSKYRQLKATRATELDKFKGALATERQTCRLLYERFTTLKRMYEELDAECGSNLPGRQERIARATLLMRGVSAPQALPSTSNEAAAAATSPKRQDAPISDVGTDDAADVADPMFVTAVPVILAERAANVRPPLAPGRQSDGAQCRESHVIPSQAPAEEQPTIATDRLARKRSRSEASRMSL